MIEFVNLFLALIQFNYHRADFVFMNGQALIANDRTEEFFEVCHAPLRGHSAKPHFSTNICIS